MIFEDVFLSYNDDHIDNLTDESVIKNKEDIFILVELKEYLFLR